MAAKRNSFYSNYVLLEDTSLDSSQYLCSNAAVVGMQLVFEIEELEIEAPVAEAQEADVDPNFPTESTDAQPQKPKKRVCVTSLEGVTLGYMPKQEGNRLIHTIDAGMKTCGWLSVVFYDQAIQRFYAEIAYIAFDEGSDAEAWETFCGVVAKKIAGGSRPKLTMGDKEVNRMIADGGNREFPKSQPMPDKRRGLAVFKKKASLADKLIAKLIGKKM